jgi:hypothetical protein
MAMAGGGARERIVRRAAMRGADAGKRQPAKTEQADASAAGGIGVAKPGHGLVELRIVYYAGGYK